MKTKNIWKGFGFCLLLFILLFELPACVLAQDTIRLGVQNLGPSALTAIDTLGLPLVFNFQVTNQGTAPIIITPNKPLKFRMMYQVVGGNQAPKPVKQFTLGMPTMVLPGQPLPINGLATVLYNDAYLKPGGNIVVVWPTSFEGDDIIASDSLKIFIDVKGTPNNVITTRNYPSEPYFKLFPNPATTYLQLETTEEITQIRIISIDGRVLKQINNPAVHVDIDDLNNGLYMIEFRSRNQLSYYTKFQKQ